MNDFLKKKYQCLIFILCFLVLVYFTYRRNLSYINEMNTDKLYCGVAAVRVLFMDKQYARSFGFVYPNMISFIAYFLTNLLPAKPGAYRCRARAVAKRGIAP